MKDYFMNLGASERRTLIIGAVLLALILVYALIWKPVTSSAENWRKAVNDKQTFVTWMNNAVQEAKLLRQREAPAANSSGQSLLALVDQTARRSQLGPALKRVEPKGSDEVRVRLEQAAFDDVMKWLTQLQRTNGISVDSVSLEKDDSPGRVSATLTLKGSS
jgi:general secretion pathway protein M